MIPYNIDGDSLKKFFFSNTTNDNKANVNMRVKVLSYATNESICVKLY